MGEHDFYVGIGLAIVLTGIVKSVGPGFTEMVNKEIDADEAIFKNIRQKEIDHLKEAIAMENTAQSNATAWEDIIAAKKEAVGLQLESVYRQRLNEAYGQVKKRLDYQLEVANVMRRMEQKHMVDWIINNVKKSISPAQETAALKKCIQISRPCLLEHSTHIFVLDLLLNFEIIKERKDYSMYDVYISLVK